MQEGVEAVYLQIDENGYQFTEEQPENRAYIGIFTYDMMQEQARLRNISYHVLEDARRFGFARYDSFENYDCISLEMPDFHNVLISHGSVVIYLEKNHALFFTSKAQRVRHVLRDCAEGLGERISFQRLIYLFLETQTKEEEVAFDQALITSQKKNFVSEIIHLRKRLMLMKRYYEQFLNLLDVVTENENNIFDGKTLRSFKMLSRRMERSYQNVLNLREAVTQIRESYEAEVDISLNTTMKVFTVVTTIFLPLTLIAGWYGMNFQMPEYGWEHGYLMVIVLSVAFIVIGIAFFKKNKWF